MTQVVTRFSPSPTGKFHLGGLRTALYNYLYAKQNGGKFILRIEDTDRTRFDETAEEDIKKNLELFGIEYDEYYVQSERLHIYRQCADELLSEGLAYYCTCKDNNEKCSCNYNSQPDIPYTIKIKFPNDGIIKFVDHVRGDISYNTNELNPQIIIKSDGFPTYHFAVVIDDHLMGVTHVMRGDEWISSTPKHSYLYRLLGWKEPVWVHLPVLLNQTGGKMSKRYGDYSVTNYLNLGYLPSTILNYVSLLGWHPSSDEEFYDMNKLLEDFSIDRISKSPAIFDTSKLNWYNKKYIADDNSLEYIVKFLETKELVNNKYLINKINYYKLKCNTLVELYEYIINYYKLVECAMLNNNDILKTLVNLLLTQDLKDIPTLLDLYSKNNNISKKDLYMTIRLALTGDVSGKSIEEILNLDKKGYIVNRLQNYIR